MFRTNRNLAARTALTQAVMMEACETRRLLSHGGGTAELTAGLLTVTGTRRSDDIMISVDTVDATKLDIMINGTALTPVNLADVTGILVDGRNGADHISIEHTLNIPATLMGGNGKDTLNGGAANDVLDGSNGKDALSGGGGDDSISGGRGNDNLDGGDGNDTLSGGKGHDNLMGDADSDVMSGGIGDDTLDGGDGTDVISGGEGNDHFHSGDDGSEKVDDGTDDVDDVDPVLV